MSTAVSDGLRSPQGQTSVEKPGGTSLMELGPLPTPRTSPYTMVKAITGKIIVAPLHCKEKDAKLPSSAEFATGTLEDKLERLDGLIRGLGQFIQGKSNLHKEVISYQCNQQAACNVTAGVSRNTQAPRRDTRIESSMMRTTTRSETKTGLYSSTADTIASVSRRQQHLELSTPGNSQSHGQCSVELSSPTRRNRHQGEGLRRSVENASDLGEELGKVLGTAATASALLHTSTIEIKDLDECATKEEVTAALDALLGVPVSKRDPVKSLSRKAYAGTQVAVVALPDDLAATALKLGHVRIGWVNCRIRAREEAARCYRCWSPDHVAARCKGPDRTELCYRCGQKGTKQRTAKANHRAFSAENEELTTIVTRPQARAALWPGRSPRTADDDENPPAQPQSLRGCPGPALRHHQQAAHRRGHLVRAIQEPCSTQHMARRCRRPSSYLGAWREFRCRSAQRGYIPTSRGPESAEFSLFQRLRSAKTL
ncbi:unnamed protein product [Trichogramma brassicae]|uniref:CCHC-type domain-containing protein n=1 Tax=Trichogramma brassicae TaxID=86971 RepID=A0A6H5ITD2_9HYME|nr:unnamed protein product [Trichogramma brassicae]